MRELVSVKKLNKLSELKVAALDLHILYNQGVAKELVDDNHKISSETFITFTKVCPCCSMDLNIHVFLYEKQLIPLKLRYTLEETEDTVTSADCSESVYSQESYNCNEEDVLNVVSKVVSNVVDDVKNESVKSQLSLNEDCMKRPQQISTYKNSVPVKNETNCEICSKTLPIDEKVLYHHFYYHKNLKIFKCNICQKEIINKKQAVDDHIATHGDSVIDGKPFICDICGSSFSNRIGIKNHLLNIHASAQSLLCPDCPGKKFKSKLSLDKHIKGCHYSKPCPHCQLVFKASNLKRHIDTVHLRKEYKCQECDVVCHAKDSLRSHMRRVHNTITATKHQCSHCDKTFADKSRYKRHLMIHQDKRPFCCTATGCGKRFREKSNLESHLRTHNGNKIYACQICSRKFADRGSYRNHVKLHEKVTGLQLDKSIKKFKK